MLNIVAVLIHHHMFLKKAVNLVPPKMEVVVAVLAKTAAANVAPVAINHY
jgi:hypothetical protein